MGSRKRPNSCLKGQRRFQIMKKIITFREILAKRAKVIKFFEESGSFIYFASTPDSGTDGINHLYVDIKGKVGYICTDRSTIPQSVVENKDADLILSFDTRVLPWGKEGEDYIEKQGSWYIKKLEFILRAVYCFIADAFLKKGYSHKAVTWSLWNYPNHEWVCPFAKETKINDKRKKDIERMVKKFVIKQMCESLMEVFKVSKAVYKHNFGEVEYDLMEMKRIEAKDSGNGRDSEEFDMNEDDVREAEKILAEEENEYEFENMDN